MPSSTGGTKRPRETETQGSRATQARRGDDHPRPHTNSSRGSSAAPSNPASAKDPLEGFMSSGDYDTAYPSFDPGLPHLLGDAELLETPHFTLETSSPGRDQDTNPEDQLNLSPKFWEMNSYTSIQPKTDKEVVYSGGTTATPIYRGHPRDDFLGSMGEGESLTALGSSSSGTAADFPVRTRDLCEYHEQIPDNSRRDVLKSFIGSLLLMYPERQLKCETEHGLKGEIGCIPGRYTNQCHDREEKEKSAIFLDYLRKHMHDPKDNISRQFSEDVVKNTDDVTDNNDTCRRRIQRTRESLVSLFPNHGSFDFARIEAQRKAMTDAQQSTEDISAQEAREIEAATQASLRDLGHKAFGEGSSTGKNRR